MIKQLQCPHGKSGGEVTKIEGISSRDCLELVHSMLVDGLRGGLGLDYSKSGLCQDNSVKITNKNPLPFSNNEYLEVGLSSLAMVNSMFSVASQQLSIES